MFGQSNSETKTKTSGFEWRHTRHCSWRADVTRGCMRTCFVSVWWRIQVLERGGCVWRHKILLAWNKPPLMSPLINSYNQTTNKRCKTQYLHCFSDKHLLGFEDKRETWVVKSATCWQDSCHFEKFEKSRQIYGIFWLLYNFLRTICKQGILKMFE